MSRFIGLKKLFLLHNFGRTNRATVSVGQKCKSKNFFKVWAGCGQSICFLGTSHTLDMIWRKPSTREHIQLCLPGAGHWEGAQLLMSSLPLAPDQETFCIIVASTGLHFALHYPWCLCKNKQNPANNWKDLPKLPGTHFVQPIYMVERKLSSYISNWKVIILLSNWFYKLESFVSQWEKEMGNNFRFPINLLLK